MIKELIPLLISLGIIFLFYLIFKHAIDKS